MTLLRNTQHIVHSYTSDFEDFCTHLTFHVFCLPFYESLHQLMTMSSRVLGPFLACLGLDAKPRERPIHDTESSHEPKYRDEDPIQTDVDDAAARFVGALLSASTKNSSLEVGLKDSINTCSWTESLAKIVLVKLQDILKSGANMGSAMTAAFQKASEAATEFAKEHPVYTTLIALGILCVLAPWVLEVLGFAELGPVEGECDIDLLRMTTNANNIRIQLIT